MDESDGEQAVQKYVKYDNYDDYGDYDDYDKGDEERSNWIGWALKLPIYYVLGVVALIVFSAWVSSIGEDVSKHFLKRTLRASRARATGRSDGHPSVAPHQRAANVSARSSASQLASSSPEVDGPNSVTGVPSDYRDVGLRHRARGSKPKNGSDESAGHRVKATWSQPDSSLESDPASSPGHTEPDDGGVGLRHTARGSKPKTVSDESAGDRVKATWSASERDHGSQDPSASGARPPDVSTPSTVAVSPRRRATAPKPHDRGEESARDRVRASWSEKRLEPQQVASTSSADVSLLSSDAAGQVDSAGLQPDRSQSRATRTDAEVPWIVHTPESFEEEKRQRQRRLKEAQDAEYAASLQADRELRFSRTSKKELARRRAEVEKEEAEARKQEAVRILGPEPDVEDACTVKLVFPNNVRRLRRFLPDDSMDRIFYSVVAETGLKPGQFTIQRSFIPPDSDASQAELKFDDSDSLRDADIRNFDTLRVTLI